MSACDKLLPNEPFSDADEFMETIVRVSYGAGEAVRLEIERLARLELPVYVWRDGRVVDARTGDAWEPSSAQT